jgi:hypothetical protein
MKIAWTKGKGKQEVDDIRSTFKASLVMRVRLAEMLEAKVVAKDRACMESDGYDCANWVYKQADAQGYKRALSEVISLINEK